MMSRDVFEERYRPRDAPSGEPMWTLHETLSQPRNHVWTIVTGDDNESEYATPNYHIVNAVGYTITEQPWQSWSDDAVWWEREPEDP